MEDRVDYQHHEIGQGSTIALNFSGYYSFGSTKFFILTFYCLCEHMISGLINYFF